MTKEQIIWNLEIMLQQGIASEHEALSFIVRIRKLLELKNALKKYEYLTFHCDWAVHARLSKSAAALKVLARWDAANVYLRDGTKLAELPLDLGREIEGLSKMEYFYDQLEDFLKANNLPGMNSTRPDGWPHFLHFYSQLIEESPLEMKDISKTIESVTLKVEFADQSKVDGDDVWFKVRWLIFDRNKKHGEVFVIHSFSLKPEPPEEFETYE